MIRNMRGLKGEEIENHNYIDQVNEAATYIFRLLFSSSLPSQSVTTQVELHSESQLRNSVRELLLSNSFLNSMYYLNNCP